MHCLSQEIIDIRELSVKGVHHCPISQGLDQLLPLFQSTMIWNYDRAASAALWDEHVATKVFRVVSSDSQLDSPDRKSVVEGKSVSVRVDLGGARIIKKKKKIHNN